MEKKLRFLTTFAPARMCAVADSAAFGPVA